SVCLGQTARPSGFAREIFLHRGIERPHCSARVGVRLSNLQRWVGAEAQLGMPLICDRAGRRGRLGADGADGQAPLVRSEAVLIYPGVRPAGAEPNGEPWQCTIKENGFRFAGRNGQLAYSGVSQFHGSSPPVLGKHWGNIFVFPNVSQWSLATISD